MRKLLNSISFLSISSLAATSAFAIEASSASHVATPSPSQAVAPAPVDSRITTIISQAPTLKAEVLKLALNAYDCASAKGHGKQNVLTVIDYSLPSSKKRMWVIDLDTNKVLFNSLVAHGKGSGGAMATKFSNVSESRQTSLGLFETGSTYDGSNGYSLRLNGLEKGFNDLAFDRAIVMHGAAYVNESLAQSGRIGRSWGCPAVPHKLVRPIVNTIKDGSLIFAYYPNTNWLNQSKFLHCDINYQA